MYGFRMCKNKNFKQLFKDPNHDCFNINSIENEGFHKDYDSFSSALLFNKKNNSIISSNKTFNTVVKKFTYKIIYHHLNYIHIVQVIRCQIHMMYCDTRTYKSNELISSFEQFNISQLSY